jgi:cyclopropane fatty-acyl-phospholipid synthase-like methyltransferase
MEFVAARSTIGSDVVRQWTKGLRPGSDVVDIGCGSGAPISQVLVDEGFRIFGIDASPTLLSMFKRRFPTAHAACEPVESSLFFSQKFDGAIAVGLLFLLSEEEQGQLINKVGAILKPGGRFLFSAPPDPCEWIDLQIGQRSLSLGKVAYQHLLTDAGMRLEHSYIDEGCNHYVDAVAEET